jgi:hypothetical protein
MNKLDINIIYLIFGFLIFPSKIKFRSISKYMHKLEIHDFYNIRKKYLNLLDDKILLNYPFIKYLNASGYYCKISDEGIKQLNLKKLNVCDNQKITNINHMGNTLIELNASFLCIINNESIKNLHLRKLNACNNKNITSVNHMKETLTELNASENCGIKCIRRLWYNR